jgi:hypothetical protein
MSEKLKVASAPARKPAVRDRQIVEEQGLKLLDEDLE